MVGRKDLVSVSEQVVKGNYKLVERVMEALESMSVGGMTDMDKAITLAYYMGKERGVQCSKDEVQEGTGTLAENGLKPYLVTTNDVTCVCVAGSAEEAVEICKARFEYEQGYEVEGWAAYTFDDYFSDVVDPKDDLLESVLLLQSLM